MPPNAAPAAYAAAAAAAGAPVTGGGAADALLLVSSYTDYGTLAHTPRGVPEAASGVAAYEVRETRQRNASHQKKQPDTQARIKGKQAAPGGRPRLSASFPRPPPRGAPSDRGVRRLAPARAAGGSPGGRPARAPAAHARGCAFTASSFMKSARCSRRPPLIQCSPTIRGAVGRAG